MTRKHFKAIAEALRRSRPTDLNGGVGSDEAYDQWQEDVSRVAEALAAFNPNFDRSRFWEAAHA